MKFQIKDLKKLLYSIQQNNIDEVNIKSQQLQLTINTKKNNEGHKTNNTRIKNSGVSEEKSSTQITAKPDRLGTNDVVDNQTNNYSTIVSPMVGTFYRAPAPNESPFVELYDMVQKKQTVCIIEAMKLMNEIEAEVNGEIVEILVQDGDIIDCGQALMKIKPLSE